MRLPSLRIAVVGMTLLILAGCQRLNLEKTVTVERDDVSPVLLIDGPKSEQKIRVDFTTK